MGRNLLYLLILLLFHIILLMMDLQIILIMIIILSFLYLNQALIILYIITLTIHYKFGSPAPNLIATSTTNLKTFKCKYVIYKSLKAFSHAYLSVVFIKFIIYILHSYDQILILNLIFTFLFLLLLMIYIQILLL